MLIWRYARRNLHRQRGRSLLTASAIVLAVALLIIGTSLIDGMRLHIMQEFARQTGHVRLRHRDYDRLSRFEPLDYTLDGLAALLRSLGSIPEVAHALPRLRFGGLLQHTDTSTIVPAGAGVDEDSLTDEQIFGRKLVEVSSVLAIDPQRERATSALHEQLSAGTYFTGAPAEIILGVDLARRLEANVGAELEIVSFQRGPRDTSARVVGIIDTGNQLLNRSSVVTLALAQALLELPDRATEILVFGADLWARNALAERLGAVLARPELTRTPWDRIGVMQTANQVFGVIFGALLAAILLVAAAGLLNTMLMNILERRREIGVLMAMGLSRAKVVGALLLEAVALAGLGAALGALIGCAGALYLKHRGIELGAGTEGLPVAVGHVMRGELTLVGVGRAVGLGLATALVGALWPAWRASALDPVEALKRR